MSLNISSDWKNIPLNKENVSKPLTNGLYLYELAILQNEPNTLTFLEEMFEARIEESDSYKKLLPQVVEKAIKSGDLKHLETIFGHDLFPLGTPLPCGQLPLQLAVLENKEDIVKLLMEQEADPTLKDFQGLSAIDHAVLMKNQKMLSLILSKAICKDQKQVEKALVNKASASAFNKLKQKTDKLLAVNVNKLTPLCKAAYEGKLDEIKKLYTNGELNKWDQFGMTPIHYAILGNQLEAVDLLAQKRADVKKYTLETYRLSQSEVDSPLHLAAIACNEKMIEKLIKLGLKPNATNKEGQTALHYGAVCENLKAMQALIQNKASPRFLDNQKISPLALVGIGALQKDPLALSYTQILLFTISIAYWLNCIGYAKDLISPELTNMIVGVLVVANIATDIIGTNWLGLGGIALGAFTSFGDAPFFALRTFKIVSSAFGGLKAAWNNFSYRKWTAARNFIVHTTNVATSFSLLWENIAKLPAYKVFWLKNLTPIERALDPSLDPTIPNDAGLILSPDFDMQRFREKGVSYANQLFRDYAKKYHVDKTTDPRASEAYIRVEQALQTLKSS